LQVLLVVMVVALTAMVARLFDVQAVHAQHYSALSLAQSSHNVTLAAERGSVFDRNGDYLALSIPQTTIYADPRVIRAPAADAAKLAPVVGIPEATLARLLGQHGRAFVYIKRKVDDATVSRVKALHIPGLGYAPESRRFYPDGSLAGPVLGFVGTDNTGLGGLEADYQGLLRGHPGKLSSETDPSGRDIPGTVHTVTAARRGGDLVLTLDDSLQHDVEQALVAEVQQVRARGGMAVISDVSTGDVLAMATVDGPSERTPARPAGAREQNAPLTTVYEPGSTNKVITVASALETGVANENTVFTVPDSITLAKDAVFTDAEPHGVQQWTVKDIMRESSNVGAIKIAALVGKTRLDHYLRAFGFGTKTAINFPGEEAGLLLHPDDPNFTASSMGSIPIGQGIAVTPMQMLDVFSTVANGGVSRPPRLIAATIGADGKRVDVPEMPGRRVISPLTASAINDMLRGVVTGGTGQRAAIPGYTVAGKTGTARKPPYRPGVYMASFAGFAPAEAPRLAAIVVIDQPGPGESYYGGDIAAPVFARIMSEALTRERVPPTVDLAQPLPKVTSARSNDVP
jgi:cell division protein FtsI (penicillin-binding protein 3)